MDEQDYKSIILYYGREKFFHSMQNKSLEALPKYPANPCFRLFNGFALVLGNRIQEGIRELNPIQTDKELGMGAILGLIYAHKRCLVVDKEALQTFDSRLKEERKQLSTQSAYYAGVFLMLSGKIEKAKEYAEKSLKLLRNSTDAMVLKGWTELLLSAKVSPSTLDLFDKVLVNGKNFDASLGQTRYHQLNSDFEAAISVLNHLSIRYPELNVPLVEKMKTQLASWNWDHCTETSVRILNLEPTNIEALRVKILALICRDGNYEAGVKQLHNLYTALCKVEPTNSELFLSVAQLFSRVCGRHPAILECTAMFIEKASQLSSSNAEYLTEMGYHAILMGRHKEATKYFRAATKLDDSSILALCGLTLCQMAESGVTEQVLQQIEFLNEIQGSTKNALLLYMTAKTVQGDADKAIAMLIEACEVQFKNLKTMAYGVEYLRCFDPDFLLQVTDEMMQYSPIQSTIIVGQVISKETLHISLKHSLNILEAVVKACPGLVQAVYRLAKVEFLCGEIPDAAETIQRILHDLDPTYTDAHLLIAQIHIQQEHYQRASQSLEICLSHDFDVRDNPMYHLLNGVIKKSQQQYDDALKCFQSAMNICGLNEKWSPSKTKGREKSNALTLADKVTLYLQMIDVYMLTNQSTDAAKLMELALNEFGNTPEEGRIIIANADLVLQQGNLSKVISLLQNIQPGQPYYLQAKTKLANVYLHQKKDRVAFAQCFKELVDNLPGPESYLMLGDAYMSIQEPDEAIDAFKMALRQNPTDPLLASKLGRAYVKTHQYNKAINYYKEATLNDKNSSLKLDLAELFLKLKQFSNAEQTLIEDIDSNGNETDDTTLLQTRTKQLLLLARIREKSGHLNSSLSTLKEARDNQHRLQKRIAVEQSTGIHEQHTIISKICSLMAEQSISLRDNQQAIVHYHEALKYSPNDMKIMTALARLYMQVNNVTECQEMCAMLLKIDANNEAASVMMADLSFRRMSFDNAAYHFSQLLINQPTYWTALARLIEVLRRSAKLSDAIPFLDRAEQNCLQPAQEAGLNYSKGLYEWYAGNPNGALRFFNNARRSSEWGQQAIFNMIEICLNPDGDLPSELQSDASEDAEVRESRSMALRTADRLLKELKPRPGGLDNDALTFRLLSNFLHLASRQKYNIEQALNDFTAIATQEEYKEHVGPILGLATAHIILKQPQRAKNQLKRAVKNVWTFEDAEYLERCWLILADLYIQANKTDIAHDLLEKVIAHNKSCAKAYELWAQLAEKEQMYRVAATRYDLAWRYGGRSKPIIGYKLAYNYMKSKRFADAIDVCQQVLKMHPDYSAIKKDVLDKCRNNLKS